MGLFYNYENSGPGVAKNGPQKSRLRIFFEVFGRKFWGLCLLNLIYILFCIPVVTIGPATAAAFKVLRNYSIEKNAFVWADFWESFKKDFKQSFPLGIIYTVAFIGIGAGIYMYPPKMEESTLYTVLFILTVIVGIFILVSSFFAFLMVSTTELTLKNIIKNSAILTIVSGWKGLVTAVLAAVAFIFPFALSMVLQNVIPLLLCFMISFSLPLFIAAFNCYPFVQKYIIEPYYKAMEKDNPEYDYLKPAGMEDGEPVFEDKGGTEAPIVKAKKTGKKNKTIS